MFKINKNLFKKNVKYILLFSIILAILLLISIYLTKNTKNKLRKEQDLTESGTEVIKKLVINEISSNNSGSFVDSEGKNYDWIELYNGSSKDINLTGYSLSDDENRDKWVFGNTTIKSKEYLIIFLAGENKEGLYANFSLSKNGGEKVVLKNKHGKVIDAVETVKMNKNTSLARDIDGKWIIAKNVTPGFINTLEGYNMYLKTLDNESKDIVINEVLVRNGGQFTDDYDDFSGYIELKNTTSEKINLSGYSLSNDINEPFKWALPNITLNGGEILLIYTSGRDISDGILHTSFKLNSKSGYVILSKNNSISQKIEYKNLSNGYALTLVNGKYEETGILSAGFDNNNDGVESFAKKYQANHDTLIINEVMNNNYEYLPQNGYNFYDWIELKNNSNQTINLQDYFLTTTLNDINMYQLPNVELKPGGYYILMASGDEKLSNDSYKHTNFKLGEVESLYLVSNKNIIDSIFISNIKTGYSYGRNINYGYIYMENPSPAKDNNSGKYEIAYSPEFSIKEGIYNDVDNMKLEISANGDIYYTLNGDEPTIYSKHYTEPINLTKTTVVRAISIEEGKIKSTISNASYIINENHTIPVMSVTIDSRDFNTIVYNSWDSIEKEAYATFFDGDDSFSIPCGFKEFGGSTRGLPKQSFTLKFRKKYGTSELHYKVFENRDNSVYNSLVLRSGSQDYSEAMIRDPIMASIMEETDVDVQAMRPVILYINGDYRGLYYLNEKIDEDFISSHYNVSDTDTNLVRITGAVDAGSGTEYENLLKYMKTHDMTKDENYDYIASKIDMDNLITFWIAETFTTNNDIINCRVFSNPNIDDGKWKFIFYDLDYGMYYYRVNYYTIMTDTQGMGSMKIRSDLTYYLFKSKKFQKRFVELLGEQLKTTWSEENILSKIENEYNKVIAEMPREQERWGLSMKTFEQNISNLKEFAKNRRSYLLAQTQSFFKLTDEEMKVYFCD